MMADEQYDPSDHTVTEVQEYLAGADDTERERVLAAERDGQARKGIVGDAPTGGTTTGSGASLAEAGAAQNVVPTEEGYIGTSPERQRTGLADKGLSQATPAVMNRG